MCGRFGPDEGLGVVVPGFHPSADVRLERLHGTVVAADQEVSGDKGEEPFDLVDPAGVGRREVHVEPRVSLQSLADGGVLVGSVVVADLVDLSTRIGALDRVQERNEIGARVPLGAATMDFPARHFESGEQARCAVPLVVVSDPGGEAQVQADDSLLNLNVSTRCGYNPCLRQIVKSVDCPASFPRPALSRSSASVLRAGASSWRPPRAPALL